MSGTSRAEADGPYGPSSSGSPRSLVFSRLLQYASLSAEICKTVPHAVFMHTLSVSDTASLLCDCNVVRRFGSKPPHNRRRQVPARDLAWALHGYMPAWLILKTLTSNTFIARQPLQANVYVSCISLSIVYCLCFPVAISSVIFLFVFTVRWIKSDISWVIPRLMPERRLDCS